MTDSPRDRARALLAAATGGPWYAKKCSFAYDDHACYITTDANAEDQCGRDVVLGSDSREECGHILSTADAALIAAAPELLTALCDEEDRLRSALAHIAGLPDDYVCDPAAMAVSEWNAMRADRDMFQAQVARLRTALRKTSDLIAANRLMLGEYAEPRYVAQVEDAARAALAETEETT